MKNVWLSVFFTKCWKYQKHVDNSITNVKKIGNLPTYSAIKVKMNKKMTKYQVIKKL